MIVQSTQALPLRPRILTAFAASEGRHPASLSLTEDEEGIEVTVRQRQRASGDEGVTASMTLSKADLFALLNRANLQVPSQ